MTETPPRPLRKKYSATTLAALMADIEDHGNQVRAWVSENQIKPALKIGDHVDITHKVMRETYRGIIVAFRSDVAEYAVSIPDLGHRFDREAGTGDYVVIEYEVLEAEQASAKQRLDQDAKEEGIPF